MRLHPLVPGSLAILVVISTALFLFRSPPTSHIDLVVTAADEAGNRQYRDSWNEEDWSIFEAKVSWALGQGLDTLSVGAVMAKIGRSFVGTAYVPGTLEVEGPESVVINFRGLDCVTFVENVFAMSRFVRTAEARRLLGDRKSAEDFYESILSEHRYRNGQVRGYTSRLHYFSDWVGDNHQIGFVRDISAELRGIVDSEAIDFMSTHTDAYAQLVDMSNVSLIKETEERLSAVGRVYVPENRINEVVQEIHDGDIIAATSTLAGLDVAHTGLALWIDETLHLLHAPLVGAAVQISETSLAERINKIEGQDGIIIARPQDESGREATFAREG
ncbi:MAG: N-acetylmuramoyl-L-alanine amidase-like domain-containing protein [Gemmatimonadota bacterium]|nr:N-acetylmuramoyl-L-alanine amidase-like domain-containing protein [Gemmatimonadota bacterium]